MLEENIPGFPGYHVTRDGRVIDLKTGCEKKLENKRNVRLRRNGKHYSRSVPLLVATIYEGKKPTAKGSDALCWTCENTNQYKCSWFAASQELPDGCSAKVSVSQVEGILCIITECPNYVCNF